jgi:digeranylgeranylglycerophospholipid reductase
MDSSRLGGDQIVKDHHQYDVLIIGAGPAGCWSALRLARAGLRVAVIEEHLVIGRPRHCTGIIGREAFERFPLPTEAIQQRLASARFFSPQGDMVRVARKEPQAYVVDRAEFDLALARQAEKAGSKFYLGRRCVRLSTAEARLEATMQRDGRTETLQAPVGLLAAGCHYRLHSQVGLEPPSSFLDSTQAELEAEGFSEVEVYFGQTIAPRSFAWTVPVGPGRVRIGVTADSTSLAAFYRLLHHPSLHGRVRVTHPPSIRKRAIPIGIVARSYADRVLAVGDAAGQVKPTTGGGIYYSILCADLAANTLLRAFSVGDFSKRVLGSYQQAWRGAIGRDIRLGLFIRGQLSRCSDHQIVSLIRLCREPRVLELIHQEAVFDWHYGLILEFLKLPAFWKTLLGWPVRFDPGESDRSPRTTGWNQADGHEENHVADAAGPPVRPAGVQD